MGVGERADQRVGEDDPPHRVVGEALLEQLADRTLDERPPGLVADEAAELADAAQRLGERREHALGERRCLRREVVPRPGVGTEAPRARRDEDAAVADRRVRADLAPAQRDVEAELVDDLRRQQADQVRVLRQLGIVGGEDTGGTRRAPDDRGALEHEHRPPGIGQVRRAGEPVVPAPDDDRVVAVTRRLEHGRQPTVSTDERSRGSLRARHWCRTRHRPGHRRTARRGGGTRRQSVTSPSPTRSPPRRASAATPSACSSTSPTTRRSDAPSTRSASASGRSTCSSTTPAGTAWSRSWRAPPRRGTSCWRSTSAARSPSRVPCSTQMIERGRGRIVSIASDAGRVGSSGEAVYSGAKAGIMGFSRTIAREVARHGINVNTVCPGPTNTALLQGEAETQPQPRQGAGAGDPVRPARRTGGDRRRRRLPRLRRRRVHHRSGAVGRPAA